MDSFIHARVLAALGDGVSQEPSAGIWAHSNDTCETLRRLADAGIQVLVEDDGAVFNVRAVPAQKRPARVDL